MLDYIHFIFESLRNGSPSEDDELMKFLVLVLVLYMTHEQHDVQWYWF